MYLVREGSQKTEDAIFCRFDRVYKPITKVSIVDDMLVRNYLLFYPSSNTEVENSARKVFETGMHEKMLIRWISENLCRPDKSFLDVGAHIGNFVLPITEKVKHTYAFECGSKAFCALAANVGMHSIHNRVSLFPFALGDAKNSSGNLVQYYIRNDDGRRNGIKPFNNEEKNALFSESGKTKVWMYSLDSLSPFGEEGIEDLGLIKLSVNGSEADVIRGMIKTLQRNKFPPIVFESENPEIDDKEELYEHDSVKAAQNRKELFELLESLGYSITILRGAKVYFLAHVRS